VRRFPKLVLFAALVLCTVAAMLLPGCGEEAAPLEGTKWIMTSYYAVDGSMHDALPEPPVDATFADGAVSGNGGINQYNGGYELDGENLTISPLASTQMAGDPAVMEQETAYLMALQAAATFEIDGGNLTINDGSGEAVLEYRSADES
jgi:heat shock protein HslJ